MQAVEIIIVHIDEPWLKNVEKLFKIWTIDFLYFRISVFIFLTKKSLWNKFKIWTIYSLSIGIPGLSSWIFLPSSPARLAVYKGDPSPLYTASFAGLEVKKVKCSSNRKKLDGSKFEPSIFYLLESQDLIFLMKN